MSLTKKPLTYHLGNLLIIISLLILAFTYLPFILVYFSPAPQISAQSKAFYIEIPKIKAVSPIIADVDPFNKKEYLEKLKKGVALAKGSSLPGEGKATFIFAHSSGAPWEITRINTVFLRLGELQKDDLVYVYNKGKKYTFIIFNKKEVDPSEVSYLKSSNKDEIILQTCTPIGTSLRRLLVFGKLK